MTTLGERASTVIGMLGGRADLATKVNNWLGQAYLELGMGFDFEELEETHNGNSNNNIATYAYPTLTLNNNNWTVRAIKALTLVGNNNNIAIPLVKKNVAWIDKLPETPGNPVIFAPWKNTIIVRPVPNTDWIMRWRVWLKPRVEYDNNNNVDANNTTVLLPDDWIEILDYSAALRGHVHLLERDKAGEIQQLLFGVTDPKTGRMVPGLIKQRMLRHQAESPMNDYAMSPRKLNYTR